MTQGFDERQDALMRALEAKFRARCAADAASIEAACRGETDESALIAVLHRVAGSGGTFGRPELSEAAAALEDAVRAGELDREALARLQAQLLAVSSDD